MKGGYYSDKGKPIDIPKVPIPELCLNCSKNGRVGEDIACNLNRNDQTEQISQGQDFICYSYQQDESHSR